MQITWPPGIGGWIAIAVAILLLVALLFFKGALDAAMLARFIFALAIAILLR